MDEDDEFGGQSSRRASGRRSTRNAASRSNGTTDNWSQWRGERRSTRLGAPPELQLDDQPPSKRARTEESTGSVSTDFGHSSGSTRGESSSTTTVNKHSAAAIKPGEIPLERVQGKRGSKFWFYAVEPIPGYVTGEAMNGATSLGTNGNGHVGSPDEEDIGKNSPEPMGL